MKNGVTETKTRNIILNMQSYSLVSMKSSVLAFVGMASVFLAEISRG
jgi:hypothetical protein